MKKLRKIAQGEAGPTTPSKSNNTTATTTPVKVSRKKAATTSTGVKKTRKPAAGGKGKKGKAVDVDDDGIDPFDFASPLFFGYSNSRTEDVPAKMESESDDDGLAPTSKKRKYEDATDGNVAEDGSVVKSESVEPAQNDFDELLTA